MELKKHEMRSPSLVAHLMGFLCKRRLACDNSHRWGSGFINPRTSFTERLPLDVGTLGLTQQERHILIFLIFIIIFVSCRGKAKESWIMYLMHLSPVRVTFRLASTIFHVQNWLELV